MKSDHRHELKTNELAEWIANFPEWAKENAKILIGIAAIAIVVLIILFWNSYSSNVLARDQRIVFTDTLTQLAGTKYQVGENAPANVDTSFILQQSADTLAKEAKKAKGKGMAALATIKQAEMLRAELHQQHGSLTPEKIAERVAAAKSCYQKALTLAKDNPTLLSLAEYGLGLCDEELGSYDEAAARYRDIVNNTGLKGTVGQASARHRLETFNRYQQQIVFEEAPETEESPNPAMPLLDSGSAPVIGPQMERNRSAGAAEEQTPAEPSENSQPADQNSTTN